MHGGAGSVHMQDMANFTSVYVNPKLRKMRMEAYAIVAPYPVDFPKIKNACLKWSWKQTPSRGWCQLPPSISHRLSEESKIGMYEFMMAVELAMVELSKLAYRVVDVQNQDKMDCRGRDRYHVQDFRSAEKGGRG